MTKWLKINKFCYKKPHGVPAKADLERQKEFITHYHELKSKQGKNDVICFVDIPIGPEDANYASFKR